MTRRQRDDGFSNGEEKRARTADDGAGATSTQACKSRRKIGAGVDVANEQLQPGRLGGGLQIGALSLGVGCIRIDQYPDDRCLGHDLAQQVEPLRPSPPARKLAPVTLPPGRFRLATRPSLTGSSPVAKTIGIVAVASLAARAAGKPLAQMTRAGRRTSSTASAGDRSLTIRPRNSRATFRPSTKPVSRKPSRIASISCGLASADAGLSRTPPPAAVAARARRSAAPPHRRATEVEPAPPHRSSSPLRRRRGDRLALFRARRRR